MWLSADFSIPPQMAREPLVPDYFELKFSFLTPLRGLGFDSTLPFVAWQSDQADCQILASVIAPSAIRSKVASPSSDHMPAVRWLPLFRLKQSSACWLPVVTIRPSGPMTCTHLVCMKAASCSSSGL